MELLLRDVSKAYEGKTVLSHFSCAIAEGCRCAVMAPSGAGKTTLLRLILGLEKPDSGVLLGIPSEKSALFQENRLLPRLSVLRNLSMAVPQRSGQEARALLEELGLGDCMAQTAGTLSGGQARRAALARALLYPGALLALDEPFTGLDEASRLEAAAAIRRHLGSRTLLLITHREEDLPLLGITRRIDLPVHNSFHCISPSIGV